MNIIEHIHPMVVHFPIALFVSSLGFGVAGCIFKKEIFLKTALYLYVLATFTAPVAVQTGLWESQKYHLHHPVVTVHQNFAFLTMWGSLISLPFLWSVKKYFPKIYLLLFVTVLTIVVGFVSVTAYNGGRLVYEYGIGVDK